MLDDGAATTVEMWGERGPVMLCVHGITSSRRSWARFAERLGTTHRVIAYDQRGHGDSAAVRGPMTLAQSVRDLQTVARSVSEPVDTLLGHSWGGAVVLLGGLELRPARVIAIDPMLTVAPGTFQTDYVEDLSDFFATAPADRDESIRAMYAGLAPLDLDGKVHAMRAMSVASLERLGRENNVDAGGWNVRERSASYPVPLLVLAAGIESVMSADDLTFLRERGGANVRIQSFPREGHNLHRTAFDEFADAVASFVET